MGVIKQAIRSAGTEMDFLTEAARVIQSLSDKIVLTDSSIPEMYADNNDGYSDKPFLKFTVGGVYRLTLTRPYALTRSTSAIASGEHAGLYGLGGDAVGAYWTRIEHIATGTALENTNQNNGMKFYFGTAYAHVETVREWRAAAISNAKVLVLQLSPYNRNLVDASAMADVMLIEDSSTHAFRARLSINNAYNIWNDTGYILDDTTQATAVNRLPYYRDSTDETKISRIQSKVLADTSSAKVFQTSYLHDVSTFNVVNRRITIAGQSYYVIDSNTLVPL